jgi:hypothetical protein
MVGTYFGHTALRAYLMLLFIDLKVHLFIACHVNITTALNPFYIFLPEGYFAAGRVGVFISVIVVVF